MIEDGHKLTDLVQARRERMPRLVDPRDLVLGADAVSHRERTRRDLQFLCELGAAMSGVGDATTFIRRDLERIGRRFGLPGMRASVGPTLLLLRYGDDDVAVLDLMTSDGGELSMDKVAAVYELARAAERGEIDADEGLHRLHAILSTKKPSNRLLRALGIALISGGVSLLLGASIEALATCIMLGALVGLIKVGSDDWPRLWPFVPVIAGSVATALAFLLIGGGTKISAVDVLVPSLAVFLPGAAMTVAMIELSSGDIVAGGSRLAFAAIRLLLLLFGIVIAEQLIGWETSAGSSLNPSEFPAQLIGVTIFTVGVCLNAGAERDKFGWLFVVVIAAWGSQQLVGAYAGPYLGAIAGAAAIVVVSGAIESRYTVNPLVLSYTPAFWLLVPGSLGLLGIEKLARSDVNAALGELMVMLLTMVAISLGVILGLFLQNNPRMHDAVE